MLFELLALASALCIALSSMIIAELNGRVPLLQLARWQMVAACLMTGVIATALGGWQTLGIWQLQYLAASSLAGIAIASTTYFATIYAVGPRITALMFSLTSPFALALGYVVLGETITPRQGAGVALVLAGIVLAIGVPRRFAAKPKPAMAVVAPASLPVDVKPAPPVAGPLLPGILLGLVTALGQAIGTLLARPAMASGVEPFAAMSVRAGLGAAFFIALLAIPRIRRTQASREPRALGLVVASAFVGATLGMSLLMAALSGGEVGIVSTLSSMTPVLVLPLVWLRSGVRPAPSAWAGAALAICGTALISLH